MRQKYPMHTTQFQLCNQFLSFICNDKKPNKPPFTGNMLGSQKILILEYFSHSMWLGHFLHEIIGNPHHNVWDVSNSKQQRYHDNYHWDYFSYYSTYLCLSQT